ncbi:uncharacterized protein DUF732 [Williamsia limnetica]|jgi:hypothetical protein|uniref:Uncharacterized protein DUF732 n=1 Tax=Williamsia limnetica TaxID=882452 RepID=A0A318RT64_WILLI|nr:DUF732 domain-containing protein [Williamsia limnetica]PYE20789.1 uncharacterized protein DUF732 [Williamsia limnetica]
MKKLVALIAFLSSVVFVGACSSEDVQNATDQARSSAEQLVDNASTAAGDVKDNGYIQALESQNATFGSREDQIAAAQMACDELSNGTSLNDTVTKIADETGLDDSKSRTLINIGVPLYCTSNSAKLAGN